MVWPHRALTPQGFVWFIGITACLIALPLIASLGSPVLWGLLPFIALAVGGIWYALKRAWRQGEQREVLLLDRAHLSLTRHDPGRTDRHWQANPYWLRVALRDDGPVEDYLTLAAEGREVELGACLSADERRSLARELRQRLAALKENGDDR
ncbi:DUF2244 domain-containing protein [Paracoccus suum]|uniref:DUF2244 domain-containing protein n=1 Tax=Paracoccus suum TaxID=2259340 RepID=UPI0030CFF4F5